MFMAASPDPGAGIVLGLNFTLTPLPCPEAVRATAELKPPEIALVILTFPDVPRVTVIDFGAAVNENVPPLVPTVTAAAAEGMPFATTNN